MKFKFLYLGNKTLEERGKNTFRVLNCEEDLSGEIENRNFFDNRYSNKESRVCFNRNGSFIDFLGMNYELFIDKVRCETSLFEKYVYNKWKCEEFDIVFFDSFTEGDFEYKEELINLIDEIDKTIEVGSLNKTLFMVSDSDLFNDIRDRCHRIGSRILKLNQNKESINCTIDTLVDFISYSERVYSKVSFENEFKGMNLMIGDVKGENCSGEIIMSILNRFSSIQSDNFFELILISADDLSLEEIALIEDALKEYIPFNSRLIIKQLTNKVFGKKIAFMLFSK